MNQIKRTDLSISYPPQKRSWAGAIPQPVTVTHKPSGYSVTCGSERSQHLNREKAIGELESKLNQADIKIKERV